MFDSYYKESEVTPIISMSTKIKEKFATDEQIEEFLKRGGKIDSLPMGETRAYTEFSINGKPKSEKNKPTPRERIAEPLSGTTKQKPADTPAPTTLNTSIEETPTVSIQEAAQKIQSMRMEQKAPSNEVATQASQKKTPAKKILSDLIKPKPKRNPPLKKQRLNEDEYQRRIFNTRNREAAVGENKKEHIGICLTHGETIFRIYTNAKKQNRSRCKTCRGIRYTPNGKVEPCSTNAQRLLSIKKSREEAIQQGKKSFLAPCKRHGLTTYLIISNVSRCKACLDARADK